MSVSINVGYGNNKKLSLFLILKKIPVVGFSPSESRFKTLESLPRGESELMPSAAYDAAAPVNVRCLLASLRQSFSAAVL